MIIECRLYCSGNKDIGEKDDWLNFAFNPADITAVKEVWDSNNEVIKEECTIWIYGQNFTIDKSFEDTVKLWKVSQNTLVNLVSKQ